MENGTSIFYFTFNGMKPEHIATVSDRLRRALERVTEGFDTARMTGLILRGAQSDLSLMENEPNSHLAYCAIADFLFNEGSIENVAEPKYSLQGKIICVSASSSTRGLTCLGLKWSL